MSIKNRPCEGEIWTGPGGVRFEVLVNAEHFVTADPLVVYREYRGRTGGEQAAPAGEAAAERLPAYVCTLEAFLEFMRPTGENVPAAQSGPAAASAGADTERAADGKKLTPEQAAFREAVFHRGGVPQAADAEGADPAFSEEAFMKAFFAASDSNEQIAIINENWRNITDRIVDNISIVLDLSIRHGNIDDRLIDLTGCLRTKSRFEGKRDRLRGE